jgi:hypothetical protein
MGSRPTSTLGAERGAVVSRPGRCPRKRAAENVARGGPKKKLQPGSVVVGGRAVAQRRSDDALRRVRAAIREKRERQTMKHHESRPLIPHCPFPFRFTLVISQESHSRKRDMRRATRQEKVQNSQSSEHGRLPRQTVSSLSNRQLRSLSDSCVSVLCVAASFLSPFRFSNPCRNTCENNPPPGRCCLLENKEAVEEEAAGL